MNEGSEGSEVNEDDIIRGESDFLRYERGMAFFDKYGK